MSARVEQLARKIKSIARAAPCEMGVSVRVVGEGSCIEMDADQLFPLASVYKVPLLATVFHKVVEGELDLASRVRLRGCDKALGSSDLQYLDDGLEPTLQDLCFMMIVHSDNTATDLVHRTVGQDAPNEYMHGLGLTDIDIYCPNREYFLLLLGWSRRFGRMTPRKLVKTWSGMTREERVEAFAEIRRENRNKSIEDAQAAGIELWGLAGEKETEEMRMVDEALDNRGSPAVLSRLLELIALNEVAPRKLTERMIGYMLLCDARSRLPARLPPSVRIGNKTGSVCGVINDSALILPSRRPPIACACFCKGVKYEDVQRVEGAIAKVGLAVYESLGK